MAKSTTMTRGTFARRPEVATMNQRLFDRFIRRAHAVERAKAGTTREAVNGIKNGFLARLEERIAGRLARIKSRGEVGPILRTKGYQELAALVAGSMRKGFRTMQGAVAEQMREFAIQQSRFTLNVLGQEFKFDFSARVPPANAFRDLVMREPIKGRTLGQWFSGLARQGTDDTLADINRGLRESESVDAILGRLTGRGGAFWRAERAADTVVETGLSHATNGGQTLALAENDEVAEEEFWSAILDSSTCMICASLDKKVFKVGEGPQPDVDTHPKCRCKRFPRIKSAKELGLEEGDLPEIERQAMDGKVPQDTTYAQWLRRQPVAVQNDVLGPTRARLWRGNKVTIDRMVDPRLRPITLDDLARREGIEITR